MIWKKMPLWNFALSCTRTELKDILDNYGAQVMVQEIAEKQIIKMAKANLVIWYFLLGLALIYLFKFLVGLL